MKVHPSGVVYVTKKMKGARDERANKGLRKISDFIDMKIHPIAGIKLETI
jgi:hypothetical protein